LKKKGLLVFLVALMVTFSMISLPVWGEGLYRIAVMPFEDGSVQDRNPLQGFDVGKGVADELVNALLATGKFRVMEREQLNKVLSEQNLGSSGRIEAGTAARIGKILGVQLLVMGKVTDFSVKTNEGNLDLKNGFGLGISASTAKVVIDARMVDTASAEIKAGVTGTGEKKQTNVGVKIDWNTLKFGSDEFRKTHLGLALRDAVTQVADAFASREFSVTSSVPVSASTNNKTLSGLVAYVGSSTVSINIGYNQGVKVGMKFKVNRVINTIKDPSTGKILDYVTTPVAIVKAVGVKSSITTCALVSRLSTKYRVAVKDRVVFYTN